MASELKYKDWTVTDTCQYLEKEKLGEWIPTFQKNNITGIVLQNLTVDRLKDYGIVNFGDCLKILESIRKLWQVTEEGKVFNDPIHGHLELHPLLIKITDTPQFQRLRNIKQLGGVYFVYPGASHNRFEHSIGVAYLAGELVKSLSTRQPELLITPTDILCVQIAGLCHDLGHGPFSHLFDDMFIPKAKKMKKEAEKQKEKKHETVSCEMFDHLVKCNNLMPVMKKHGLNPIDLDFIKEMIAGPLDSSTTKGKWPYKGRTEEKSFLYEIVSNKRNGIDVDKFDYFARDCYHLGIQNNFDYRRFLKFARVCEVKVKVKKGETRMEKQICVREKEVHNLYNMFHTRYCIHRRACQHKVNSIIQTMIADAFVKADEHIQIEGSGGKMFTLSTAINDMEAYTKLTDCVFEQILNSPSKKGDEDQERDKKRDEDMAEAKEILQRIISRDLYKCLGETHYETSKKGTDSTDAEGNTGEEAGGDGGEEAGGDGGEEAGGSQPSASKKICDDWEEDLTQNLPDGLKKQDFEVTLISIDYGMKDKDPIKTVHFYAKDDPNNATKFEDQVSRVLPKYFSDQLIRFYYKKTDDTYLKAAEHFDKWSKDNGIPILKTGLKQATPEVSPGENNQNN